jgi:ABC-type arginine/histidine transport system permease subunit
MPYGSRKLSIISASMIRCEHYIYADDDSYYTYASTVTPLVYQVYILYYEKIWFGAWSWG